jgi:hypothetical protein
MEKNNLNEIINKKCAPTKEYKDGSCLSLKQLVKIANKYNKTNDDDLIDINQSKESLVIELENKLANNCSNQVCWLRLDIVKELNDEEINNNTFRPKGPSNKYDWLSTTHINNVIEQYQNKYNDFYFIGAVPYDFEDLSVLGLKNINFNELEENGKTKIGMVINLDEHYKTGSHWVSLYFNLIKSQIYFFDSVGREPEKRIRKFINKITKYLYKKKYGIKLPLNDVFKKLNSLKKFNSEKLNLTLKKYTHIKNLLDGVDIQFNNIQHQFKDSECGVYSINFITRLVADELFESVIKDIKKDDEMNKFRSLYFYNVI